MTEAFLRKLRMQCEIQDQVMAGIKSELQRLSQATNGDFSDGSANVVFINAAVETNLSSCGGKLPVVATFCKNPSKAVCRMNRRMKSYLLLEYVRPDADKKKSLLFKSSGRPRKSRLPKPGRRKNFVTLFYIHDRNTWRCSGVENTITVKIFDTTRFQVCGMVHLRQLEAVCAVVTSAVCRMLGVPKNTLTATSFTVCASNIQFDLGRSLSLTQLLEQMGSDLWAGTEASYTPECGYYGLKCLIPNETKRKGTHLSVFSTGNVMVLGALNLATATESVHRLLQEVHTLWAGNMTAPLTPETVQHNAKLKEQRSRRKAKKLEKRMIAALAKSGIKSLQ